MQAAPCAQAAPVVQHGSPAPPHTAHAVDAPLPLPVVAQTRELEQASPLQQISPAPPHAAQTLSDALVVSQSTAGAVQPTEPQHCCPAPPHVVHPASGQLPTPHREPVQSPPPLPDGQAEPWGVQMSATQHPLSLHVLSAQQGWPAPPQAVQKPLVLQAAPALHVPLLAQGCPAAPAAVHAPFQHARPTPHAAASPQGPASAVDVDVTLDDEDAPDDGVVVPVAP
jgi:hypothetical protein